LYSIGEFSRITGITIKALRLYHKKGLLEPVHVDPFSGYRYYDAVLVDKARLIVYLRGLDFSLAEIKEVLDSYEADADLSRFLRRKREQLNKELIRYKNMLQSLDSIIAREERAQKKEHAGEFEIEEKDLPTILIASIRMRGKYSDSGELFARLGQAVAADICGPALGLFYDEEYKEDNADFEVCLPVREGKEIEGIAVRSLEGGHCVSLIHKGPFEELGRSYGKIFNYLQEKKYHPLSPSREVYLKGPGMELPSNSANYLTEIQFMIAD